MDLQDAVAYHQLVLAAQGRSEDTQRKFLYFEQVFLRYLDDAHLPLELSMLDPPHVLAAMLWYEHQDPVTRTAGPLLVGALGALTRFLEHEGLIDRDPLESAVEADPAPLVPHSNVRSFHCDRCEQRAYLAGVLGRAS